MRHEVHARVPPSPLLNENLATVVRYRDRLTHHFGRSRRVSAGSGTLAGRYAATTTTARISAGVSIRARGYTIGSTRSNPLALESTMILDDD